MSKVGQLLLHQEPPGLDGEGDPHHRTVSSMGRPKGIVDIDVTEFGEGGAKGLDLFGSRSNLLPRCVLSLAFFFRVEAKVFKKNY